MRRVTYYFGIGSNAPLTRRVIGAFPIYAHHPIAIIAGSGIDVLPLLDHIDRSRPFTEFPGLVPGGVEGHPGLIVEGRTNGQKIVLQLGRLHIYEGYDYATVSRPVDILAELGVRTIVFTNAAGGLAPEMLPGELMTASALTLWPCRRWPDHPSALTPTFTLPGCNHTGAYLWIHGPTYETRAEIAALQTLDAHAVGMSTAPELARANELGLDTAVVSCITNNCGAAVKLTHEHVIDTAQRASAHLRDVLRAALPRL